MDSDISKEKMKWILLSTAHKDYVAKPVKMRQKYTMPQEFADPIAEGFKNYLQYDAKELTPPYEDGELYLDKFKEMYPKIGEAHFKTPVDKEIILREKVTKGMVTEYQTNYCDIEQQIAIQLGRVKSVHLLSEDDKIPLTTYDSFFRDTAGFKKQELTPAPDVLDANVLGRFPTVSETEYRRGIASLGGFILDTNLERRLKQTK